ncbi:hypothetical protein SEA_ARCANINE_90 [Mycobacterium phage Arcanine]|nr:hypothetical protein SEA_ARCANINE_90 [Mycobacterium phage Arcanine]
MKSSSEPKHVATSWHRAGRFAQPISPR